MRLPQSPASPDPVVSTPGRAEFPKNLPLPPNIFEMSPSEFPILNVNLSGDYNKEDLREYAEYLNDEIHHHYRTNDDRDQ